MTDEDFGISTSWRKHWYILYEAFGLPILEAMSCNTPVITSDLGAMREVDGESVVNVDPEQTQNVAEILAQIERGVIAVEHPKCTNLTRATEFT